jgi:DNA-binding transcriptional ArsR family regulator
MTDLNRASANDLLVALRHPLRRDILCHMADREAVSPRELANALDRPLSNVSYHVRVLADRAAIALVRTEPVRGSTEHFYRVTIETPWVRQLLGLGGAEWKSEGESST